MRRLLIVAVLAGLCVANIAAAAEWRVPGHFATIQEAIDSPAVAPGDVIIVGPGAYAGALVSKSVEIRGQGWPIINSGPPHPATGRMQGFRLLAGSDGAVISHFAFTVDLGVFNGESVNDVTVVHNRFVNAYQAVSNWSGSGWDISHNDIVDLKTGCGGGIGILVGDWRAVEAGVQDNLVSHNTISGTLHVAAGDCGGYAGAGIVLYADFREGAPGAVAIANNTVIRNRISIVSDNPELVGINAIELTDTRDETGVIYDNAIGFNDLRGTVSQIALTPEDLADFNAISRNLGSNRGHGLHPSVFGPIR